MYGRPVVSVFDHSKANSVKSEVKLPAVFTAPLRPDVVAFVHDQTMRNTRQAHGINFFAGMKHSALSWGTGRAVSRIPRIRASGTSRANQGANGNMCRAGRMAFPLRTWRRWHRKVNLRQRRHALAAAISASAVTPLVLARGHKVMEVPQLPLVFSDEINQIGKTKEAVTILKQYGIDADIKRVAKARTLRAGKGKMRNRRFKERRGPLFVGDDQSANLARAIRNIPGVDYINVNRLNLRHLAPGGHLGRFCIFTEGAFKTLNQAFGGFHGGAAQRKNYNLLNSVIKNADVAQIINSNEVQSVLNPAKPESKRQRTTRKNPLKDAKLMAKLNPYAPILAEQRKKDSGKIKAITKKQKNQFKKKTRSQLKTAHSKVADSVSKAQAEYRELMKQTKL